MAKVAKVARVANVARGALLALLALSGCGSSSAGSSGSSASGASASGAATADAGAAPFEMAIGLSADDGHRLHKEDVFAVIRARQATFLACFEAEATWDPKLAGTIRVRFRIEPAGQVSSASIVDSTLPNAGVEQCLVAEVRKLAFPAIQSTRPTEIVFPFVFRAQAAAP